MKYKRMLCWVRPHEKKELEKAVSDRFPLIFAKNFDDFKQQIKDNDYLVISISRISIGWDKINNLIKEFTNNLFHLLDKKAGYYTVKELLFLTAQSNIINKKYYPEEIVEELKIHS